MQRAVALKLVNIWADKELVGESSYFLASRFFKRVGGVAEFLYLARILWFRNHESFFHSGLLAVILYY
jgi:hypothetical protein